MLVNDQEQEKEEVAEDDRCFVCGDGGRLVLCDFPGCPRVYHQVTHHTYPTFPHIHVASSLTYLHTSSPLCPTGLCLDHLPGPFRGRTVRRGLREHMVLPAPSVRVLRCSAAPRRTKI